MTLIARRSTSVHRESTKIKTLFRTQKKLHLSDGRPGERLMKTSPSLWLTSPNLTSNTSGLLSGWSRCATLANFSWQNSQTRWFHDPNQTLIQGIQENTFFPFTSWNSGVHLMTHQAPPSSFVHGEPVTGLDFVERPVGHITITSIPRPSNG